MSSLVKKPMYNELYAVCKSNWRNGYKRTKGLDIAKEVIPSLTEKLYSRTLRTVIYNELGLGRFND